MLTPGLITLAYLGHAVDNAQEDPGEPELVGSFGDRQSRRGL